MSVRRRELSESHSLKREKGNTKGNEGNQSRKVKEYEINSMRVDGQTQNFHKEMNKGNIMGEKRSGRRERG